MSVPREKKDRIKEMAKELRESKVVSVRQAAALTGLIIACTPAIGRAARFYTRTTVSWIQSLVDKAGWEAKGEMTVWVKVELSFWEERMDEFSGQLIRKAASILTWYVCSDSGEYQIGGRVEKKGSERVDMRFQVTLEPWESKASSTYRELRSIESGLVLIAPEARGTVVRYGNDNYSAVRAVMFGSTKPDCQEVAVRIHEIVEDYQIQLEVVWRRRSTEEIVLCDRISKEFDLSEYRIQRESFDRIAERWGPFSMDWFASDWSHQLDSFCSKYWTIDSTWTDAFCQDLPSPSGRCCKSVGENGD